MRAQSSEDVIHLTALASQPDQGYAPVVGVFHSLHQPAGAHAVNEVVAL